MGLSKEIVYLRDFREAALKLAPNNGRTTRFSTGVPKLDKYLSGGFGREGDYEIVGIFGPTGVGKSTVALNFLRGALVAGERVGVMALEDGGADVYLRLSSILGADRIQSHDGQVQCLPQDTLDKRWKLPDLLELIQQWYESGIDLILLDHLQFAFENADLVKGENEYVSQRIFMRDLNVLIRKLKKTIILISHVNKDPRAKGVDKIIGSSSIAHGATKLIEVQRGGEPSTVEVRMWKSRFTKTPDWSELYKLRGARLEEI